MQAEAIADKALHVVDEHFPLDHQVPMAIVEYATVRLAEVDTPAELAFALSDFLRTEVIDFIDIHSKELYVLGLLWSSTVKRLIESYPIADFPYDVLTLPLLFDRWKWQYEMSQEWLELYENLKNRLERLPPDTQSIVDFSVVMFFIEALFSSDNTPFDNMSQRLSNQLPSPKYTDALLAMGMILGRNGWDIRFQ